MYTVLLCHPIAGTQIKAGSRRQRPPEALKSLPGLRPSALALPPEESLPSAVLWRWDSRTPSPPDRTDSQPMGLGFLIPGPGIVLTCRIHIYEFDIYEPVYLYL